MFEVLNTMIDIVLAVLVMFTFYVIVKLLARVGLVTITFAQIFAFPLYAVSIIFIVSTFLTFMLTLYNSLFTLASYINNVLGGVGGADLSCLSYLLSCGGIDNVLSMYITELLAVFVVVIFLRSSFIFHWLWDKTLLLITSIGKLLGGLT